MIPASVWNDVQCPDKTALDYEGLDMAQCDLRINHEGPHRVLVTWEDGWKPPLGPPVPLEYLGPDDPEYLVATTLGAYAEALADNVFATKPMLWQVGSR